MRKRLLKRGESSGRIDDNESAINKRLQTFHEISEPVVDYYEKQNKLKRIDAEREPDVIFDEIRHILEKNNELVGMYKAYFQVS